ncbi:MAG TPA: S1C family serine protease [Geminicoccaceae bacterium]|nr:S1C family serine protease [Geminicoccus sp.]HMU53033.1 S1C family serine protease [Geminicoccaceae bacterium]
MRPPTARPLATLAFALLAGLLAQAPVHAAPADVLKAVVGVRAEVPGDARTADTLGTRRAGTGVVIDSSGLVLTIGYLVVEASAIELRTAEGAGIPAELVGYDHDTGFGLVRATAGLGVAPMPLGSSGGVGLGDPLLVVSRAGTPGAIQAKLVDRREFAGYWEYLLPDALFTAPAMPEFGGAALIDREGRLVGIGSLMVGDANGPGIPSPGNMFVPVDALKERLGDLLAFGRPSGPGHPWLGMTTREIAGHLVVAGVSADGPAARAGLGPGDILVGVGDQSVSGLADLYRKIWATGEPGVTVPLKVYRPNGVVELPVSSIDRLRWLKLQRSF